jgi:hypothetical protein
MAVDNTEFDSPNHIIGDYYFVNDVSTLRWFASAFLCVTLPPVGIFFVTWFVIGCIKSEDSLTDN